MTLSYIRPRKKSIISPELQLLFIFFSITIIMLLATYIFLLFKDYRFSQDKEYTIKQLSEIKISQADMEDRIDFIRLQKRQGEKIYTKNSVLKDSITNLFDLVPKKITLSEAKLLRNGLILYGITPNKDVYNFMLQAPLKSIFSTTYSSFYPAKNGWLRFISTNYMESSELENNEKDKKIDEEELEDEG